MSSIYKPLLKDKEGNSKKCKYYYISYYRGFKKYQFSLQVKKRIDALKMQDNIDKILVEGDDPRKRYGKTYKKKTSEIPRTLGELVDEFLAKTNKSENTMRSLKVSLKTILINNDHSKIEGILNSRTLIKNISFDTVDLIYDELEKRYTQNSQNTIAAHFKWLFKFAVKRTWLEKNPMNLVDRFPGQVQVIIETFSDEEIEDIEEYLADKGWFKDYIQIDFQTGLRKSELFHLTWPNVDFKNRFLMILGKGDKYRPVPMSQKVFDILNHRKDQFDSLKIKPLNNRVFWKVTDVDAVYERFVRMRNILGFKKTVHDIRHTFATNFLRKGGSIVVLQKILGHSDIKTTLRYEHLVAADLQNNIDQFTQYG